MFLLKMLGLKGDNTKMADKGLESNKNGLEAMEKDSDYEMDVEEEEEATKEEEEENASDETSGTSTRAGRSRSVPGRARKTSSGETTDRSSSLRSTRLSVNPDFAAKHRRFLNSVSDSLEDEPSRTRVGRSRERTDKMSDRRATRSRSRAEKMSADKPAVRVGRSRERSHKISDKPVSRSQDGSDKMSDKPAARSQDSSDKTTDEPENRSGKSVDTSGKITDTDFKPYSRASRSRSRANEARKRGREEEDKEEEEEEVKKEVVEEEKKLEEEQQDAEGESPKRKKRFLDKNSDAAPKPIREGVDMYCWKCHREGTAVSCKICPRVFHLRCLHLETTPPIDWVCPECSIILYAENTETRSPAMKSLTLDQLCNLLKFTLARMKSYPGSEWFCKPVDTSEFPAYSKYVVRPMDLSHLEKNIKQKRYGSTHAFYADTQWLLHNSVIFNTYQSKLTNIAKVLVKIGKQELDEIETCPECYLNAHTRKDSWFIEACKRPHTLVWAKLKGFPFWPAKAMKTNAENLVDVRFFGAHDRAWVPIKNVFLYSKLNPGASKNKRKNQFDDCISEVQQHIKKLRDKFGEFVYPPFKCNFDASKEDEQLEAMLPGYKTASRRYGKLLGPVRNFSSPATSIQNEVKKESNDSAKKKASPDKSKKNGDGDSSSSPNCTKSSNDDEDLEEEEHNDDSDEKEEEEEGGDDKEEKIQSPATSASSSPDKVKSNTDPIISKGDVKVETPTVNENIVDESGNKDDEAKNEEEKIDDEDEVIELPAKRQLLDKTCKEDKQAVKKSPAKTDFAVSLQEKLQRMMKKETIMNSLELKSKEMVDEEGKKELTEKGRGKEDDVTADETTDVVADVVGDEDKEKDAKDKEKVSKDKEKDSKDKEKDSKDKEKNKDVHSTEKSSNEGKEKGNDDQSVTSSIDLVSEDDEPEEKDKCKLVVKNLGASDEDASKGGNDDQSLKPKAIDTIRATIEEVVQNPSLVGSRKVDGSKKLTGIVDSLNQYTKGSRISSTAIAKADAVIDCDDDDDLDIDNPRLISLLKARDPSCCSAEEMDRGIFSPNRRKGFPSKVRRNGSSASSCSSDLSSVEELKRICAEQELRGDDRKRPSTTPIDEMAEDSYSVLDEVSGQFMKKRMEKGNVTITLVSDDESPSKKSSADKSRSKGTVSLSRDVSLSIVREDTKTAKDLSLDMECVESDTDEMEGRPSKHMKGGGSAEASMQLKPTARKSFPNAPNFGNKTLVTKTRDGGSEMTRRMSAADIQVMNQQQNGGSPSSSSTKVSPIPSPKNQTSTSASFYTKISKIAASSPASEEVQISNTMSLKVHPVDPSSSSTASSKSATGSKSSPPPAIPLTAFHVPSSSSLSATVAPTPSSSSTSSSRPLMATTVTQAARVLPQLQLKPPTAPAAASAATSAAARSLLRGNFGPATGRMDAMSQRLAESMMQLMEDMLGEMAHEGRFEARLKQMQLELERTQWKYRQEMAEYKHNTDLMIMEMRAGFEAERHRAIMDVRMKCQAEKEAAINDTKMKQWCALCKKEALFYCCWNTAYCNYPCQQEHWPQHMANCAQTSRTQEPPNGPKTTSVKMMAPFNTSQKTVSISPTQSTSSTVNSVIPQVGQTYPGPRSKTHSHVNQAQFIRQNLHVATSLMSSQHSSSATLQQSNSNSKQQNMPLHPPPAALPHHHALPPTVTMAQQPNVSNGGLRIMRAPLMCRPPIGFTIRPPQYLVAPRAPAPMPPPGFYQ